jgi:exonuclease III
MSEVFRVLTWNCRKASLHSPAWDYLLELDPDIALLQDFRTIPDRVIGVYATAPDITSAGEPGKAPIYFAEVLAKGTVSRRLDLPAPEEWIKRELEAYRDFFTARLVTLDSGLHLTAMSVYSPAFALDTPRLDGIDTSSIRLAQHTKIFGTELLWATLATMRIRSDERFVIAGDFNSSETFDVPKPRGNRDIMDRLGALDLTEALRESPGQLTPTFRSPRGGYITHQLDHMYVSALLLDELVSCDVGLAQRVFEPRPTLSDHLPIVADFRIRS